MTPQEELCLVEEMRRRPPPKDAVWGRFYDTFAPELEAFLRWKFPNLPREDQEEVVQDSLFKFCLTPHRFNGEARVKTLLFAFARNAAISRLRKKGIPRAKLEVTEEIAVDPRSGHPIEELEAEDAFAAYEASLSAERRKVLALRREQEKKSVETLAEALGVSKSTMYAHLAQMEQEAQSYIKGESSHA